MDEAPGPGPAEAADALARCLESLLQAKAGWSAAAGRGDAAALRDAYLAWAESAEVQLAGLPAGDALVEGLYTRRWSEIRSMSAGSPRPSPLVEGEAAFQRARLERALRDARAAADAAPPGPSDPHVVRAIADTNVFLHYEVFDRPWPSELGARAVRLVVPLIVLRELDAHKNRGGALGRRAAKAASRILALTDDGAARSAPLAQGVNVEIAQDPPGHDPRSHADVELLDRAAALAAAPGGPVVVVTADAGVKVSARARGLRYAQPPDDWRLPDADPVVKENARLRAQAAAAASARPRLAVVFAETGKDRTGPGDAAAPEPTAARERALAESELPVRARQPFSIASEGLDVSNADRRAWYEEVEQWAADLDRRRAARARAVPLDLEILNTGGAAAADVELELAAPEGHQLVVDEDVADTDRPDMPTPALYVRTSYASEVDLPGEWESDGSLASAHARLVRQGGGTYRFDEPVWLVRQDGLAVGATKVGWTLRGTSPPVHETGELHVLPRPGRPGPDGAVTAGAST